MLLSKIPMNCILMPMTEMVISVNTRRSLTNDITDSGTDSADRLTNIQNSKIHCN